MLAPKNIKLVIAYHGGAFSGWQKCSALSIEEALESALKQILQHEICLQAASRTDAGVHAQGQTVNFLLHKEIPTANLLYRLNAVLPRSIAALEATEMPLEFHPTLSSKKKHYQYLICSTPAQLPFHRETSWHFPYPLNQTAMEECAAHLLGTHDFSAFCNERSLWDRNPICTLETIQITSTSGRHQIDIIGDHFLYKMVRNLVGAIAYVGCGKLDPQTIPAIIASKDRTSAAVTAPAHGLCLKEVFY